MRPRRGLVSALVTAVVMLGCSAPTEPGIDATALHGPDGPPPVPAGWDPDGADQLVTYTRATDEAIDIGLQVSSAGDLSWQAGSIGAGCVSVRYPWSMTVGPRDGDRSRYVEAASSGDAQGGTMTLWVDSGPDGVTMGWGRPAWATQEAPADCGG
jgi:hypothetical protein